MNANVNQEIEMSKQLTEKQKSLLNLAKQFKQTAALILGEDTRVDISITVPQDSYEEWMKPTLTSDGVWIGIKDDSLAF